MTSILFTLWQQIRREIIVSVFRLTPRAERLASERSLIEEKTLNLLDMKIMHQLASQSSLLMGMFAPKRFGCFNSVTGCHTVTDILKILIRFSICEDLLYGYRFAEYPVNPYFIRNDYGNEYQGHNGHD